MPTPTGSAPKAICALSPSVGGHKYGCGILANVINVDLNIVIFRLKLIELGPKFD